MKKDYNNIHASINSNYSTAISNYATQRQQFIQSLKSKTIKDETDFIEQLNNTIAQEVMSGELGEEFDKAFAAIHDKVEEIIVKQLEGKNTLADIQNLIPAFQQKLKSGRNEKGEDLNKVNLKNFYNRLIEDIEQFLSTNEMTRDYIQKVILSENLNPSAATSEVVLNQFYGYARRVMFSFLTGQKTQISTKKYKSSLKGYYKEDLLTDGLTKILKDSGLQAYGTGATPNESGQQIEMDIFIGKSSSSGSGKMSKELLEKLSKYTGSNAVASSTMEEPSNIGMQSKSWIEPWANSNVIGNRKFLSVGSRSKLLNSLAPQGLYDWHDGALMASENLQQILGINNVLFSTGNGVIWTADLISKFKIMQYYLAFYISKKNHRATGEVVWEQDPGHN